MMHTKSFLAIALMAVIGAFVLQAQAPDILYYQLNETTGTTTTNSASPGQGTAAPTFSAGPTWITPGNLGASHVQASTFPTGWAPGFTATDPWTVEVRVNIAPQTSLNYIFGNGTFRCFCGGVAPTGGFVFRGFGANLNLPGTTDSTWHHIAITYDGAGTVTGYVDGTQVNQNTGVSATIGAALIVGNSNTSGAFTGQYDEFRFWGSARTQTQIAANMNSEISTLSAPNITSTAPANAFDGQLYTYTPTATGSPTPTFSITSGTLPAWLTLVGGVLSGTPGTADIGTVGPLTLTATNSQGTDDEIITINVQAAGSEIDIADPNAAAVTSGATMPIYAATAGNSSTGVFVITNNGNIDLTFANTPVITESALVNCTLNTTNPTGPITAGNTSNFTVDVTPTAIGAFSFTFTIANNDADEGSFVINFSGIATTAAEAEIAVWDPNSANVANNGTFAESNTGTAVFNRTFTIRNEGGAALTLTGGTPVVVSGEANCTVGITQPTTPVGAATTWVAGSDTVVFAITPTAAGAFSFVVTIANNDVDEGTFVFTYSGNTAAGSSGGGGGSDSSCSTGSTSGYSWMALLGLLSALVVFTRVRGSKA